MNQGINGTVKKENNNEGNGSFMYKCSTERMGDKISTFSKFGDAGHGGITRYSLSPEADVYKRHMQMMLLNILYRSLLQTVLT